MIITTESGSVYNIRGGFCVKIEADGYRNSMFHVWHMRAVDGQEKTLDEILNKPDSPPEIGKPLFVMGRDQWWLSTKVINIELEPIDNAISL